MKRRRYLRSGVIACRRKSSLAIRDKKLLPVAKLDRGFIFPEYPAQVVVSYFEAGSICDYIKSKWGEGKLLDMVHSYAQRKTTPEVIQADLGVSTEEFDKAIPAMAERELWGKWLPTLTRPAKRWSKWQRQPNRSSTTPLSQRAKSYAACIPNTLGPPTPMNSLPPLTWPRATRKPQMLSLLNTRKSAANDPATLKKLASLEEELGQPKEAAATLDRINYIYPVHDEDLASPSGRPCGLDNRTIPGRFVSTRASGAESSGQGGSELSSSPRRITRSGQKDKAEENVLAALEAAPGYRPAQKLLLEIKQPEQKDAPKTN